MMFSCSISARMWISFSMSSMATPRRLLSNRFFLMYLAAYSVLHKRRKHVIHRHKKVCFEKCVKFAVTDSSLVPLFEIRPNFVCLKWPVIRGDSYTGRISPSAEVIKSTGSLQRSGQWKMRTPYSRAVNGKCGLTTAERSTENTDSLQRLYTYILYTAASRVKK